ncbi:ABC transporter substrate-binding protein [Piscinibacterium candidicorallinum]|uniref:ABC transporter substrate-binding protein n=1 Tax=Piscinibacterium candidicorallinum TaxID=1793872 RepID=A0ABV7H1Q9_9BURK
MIRTFALAAACSLSLSFSFAVHAQQAPKLKVGLMLPYTGTFAQLGNAIENGFRLHLAEQGGKLGGREVEIVRLDDESDPAKATDNINKLINRDKVDVVVGSVHSGVAMAMARVAREAGIPMIVPNAGAAAITGNLCAPNIFRSSFTNWQPAYAMGQVMREKGYKRVVTITWKYAAGDETVAGFKEGLEAGGQSKVIRELNLPFPNSEFQALLTEIAAIKPDAVYTFFSGGGAVKFLQDYAAAGLRKSIPLYGVFITDGTLEAAAPVSQGIETTLHYSDDLNTPRNRNFRLAYAKTYKLQPDVFAVQGYDAAQMLATGVNAVKGDLSKKDAFTAALRSARIDSPRGAFTLSRSHNPVQDFYLRKVDGKENKTVRVAVKALADPGRGCRM